MLKSAKFGLATVNHQYSDEEKQILHSYQSLDYMPPHSKVYRNWLQQQPARLDWDRWLMMGLIGTLYKGEGELRNRILLSYNPYKSKSSAESGADFYSYVVRKNECPCVCFYQSAGLNCRLRKLNKS